MATYTLIMDFGGGTYISQVDAGTPKDAMTTAVRNLEVSEIPGLGQATKGKLLKEIIDDDPTPIRGVNNVWCLMTGMGSRLALFNLIKTDTTKT